MAKWVECVIMARILHFRDRDRDSTIGIRRPSKRAADSKVSINYRENNK